MATLQPLSINQPGPREPPVALKPVTTGRPEETFEDAPTPTRDSFAAANGKRTLPMSPTEEEPSLGFLRQGDLKREGSHRSTNSQVIQDQDIDMIGSDEDGEGSENDSQDDDTERPSKKKKKGQRFFCTDYPPCNLSFTRSEHLARHIRKHTGERPFQCHCSRRFSRLDNLRQHAQTVHVNEDIPGDSLAATGTRFQRQIRTDRVRPPGARARASTGGSSSGHRGHGRNLSTSSIASTTSNASTMSAMSSLSRENSGRRPHSISLADQRRGLTIDTMRISPTHGYSYGQPGGSGNSTPTSYYGTPSSPFGSTIGSPVTISRNSAGNPWAGGQMTRRLSVPSGASLFPASGPAPQIHNPATSINSSNSSVLGSPTSSTFSVPRTEVGAEDWRRRTWHPNTYSNYSYPRPATSGLSYSQTPNEPRPAFAPQALAAASQSQKLPGIETFDQMSNRPSTPPQRGPLANTALTPGRLSLFPTPDHRRQPGHGHQRGVHSWDMSLHQNLTRLDIAGGTPPRDAGGFAPQRSSNSVGSLQSSPQRPIAQPQHVPNSGPIPQVAIPQGPVPQGPIQHVPVPPQLILPSQSIATVPEEQAIAAPPAEMPPHAIAPPGAQRAGWPMSVPHKLMRGNSGDSIGSDRAAPALAHVDYQPTIIHANGYIERRSDAAGSYSIFPGYPQYSQPRPAEFARKPDTSGLDALVAVATSESRQLPAQP